VAERGPVAGVKGARRPWARAIAAGGRGTLGGGAAAHTVVTGKIQDKRLAVAR
jgi:hypothetical protein